MSDWKSKFSPGDRVTIDGDRSLVGIASRFMFTPMSGGPGARVEVEIAYVHSGDAKTAWVEEGRLALAEKVP